ncbi:MAG: hypothetical protein H0X17_15145 [Deltaproteobacteria bacterium]|nr:hypothetical protein [Deltaproteobacteria bacterium]
MNRIAILATSAALSLSLAACKKQQDADGSSGGATASKTTGTSAAKVPTLTVSEADWVEKDLKQVSPLVNITMKVPKDATLEKNGNGGVDVLVSDFYMLTVSNLAVSNVAEAITSDKSLSIGHSSYINGKVLVEEPTGFIYTMQMKDEENGTKYQPETHFAYYVEKDGAIYSIKDEKPMKAFSTPGSAYTEDLAKRVHAIVKSSAKAN